MEAPPALAPVVGDLARGELHQRSARRRPAGRGAPAARRARRRRRIRRCARRARPPRPRRAPARAARPARAPSARALDADGQADQAAWLPSARRSFANIDSWERRFSSAEGIVQPLKELALLGVEPPRHEHVHDHAQVALRPRRSPGMPAPRSTITSPGWVPGASSTGTRPLERLHLERRAEGRERRWHVERGDQVVAVAHEALVGAHAHRHVQVAGRGPGFARVAVAAQADALAIGDAGGDVHIEVALDLPAPTPAALAAGLLGDAPVAVTGVAEHRAHHLTEGRARHGLHLAGSVAALAGLDRRARLRAVSVAVLAAVDRLVAHLHAARRVRPRAARSRSRARCRRPVRGPGGRRPRRRRRRR